MAWEFNGKSSVFLQIVDIIKAGIISGKYSPGSQIPPVRQLAAEAAVNPNTMQRALSELENQGLLETRGTTGRFVTSDIALLRDSNKKAKEDAMKHLVDEAASLGITDEEIIAYITDRQDQKEAAGND